MYMYILLTLVVFGTLWSLAENDKAHTTAPVTAPAPAIEPVPVTDEWVRVQRRIDRDCGTAVLPDLVIHGELHECLLAMTDRGAHFYMRRPGMPWILVAEEDVPSSDYVRWAKARWTALGGKA